MGDRVAVLKDGLLMQVDSPRRMYDHPNNVFVAGFIGSPAMNLLTLDVVDNGVKFGSTTVPVPRDTLQETGSTVTLGVRPEDLDLSDDGLPVEVDVVEELGADAYLYGRAKMGSTEQQIIARVDGRRPPTAGSTVRVVPKANTSTCSPRRTGSASATEPTRSAPPAQHRRASRCGGAPSGASGPARSEAPGSSPRWHEVAPCQ